MQTGSTQEWMTYLIVYVRWMIVYVRWMIVYVRWMAFTWLVLVDVDGSKERMYMTPYAQVSSDSFWETSSHVQAKQQTKSVSIYR